MIQALIDGRVGMSVGGSKGLIVLRSRSLP